MVGRRWRFGGLTWVFSIFEEMFSSPVIAVVLLFDSIFDESTISLFFWLSHVGTDSRDESRFLLERGAVELGQP